MFELLIYEDIVDFSNQLSNQLIFWENNHDLSEQFTLATAYREKHNLLIKKILKKRLGNGNYV